MNQTSQNERDLPGQVDLVKWVMIFWARKRWIIACTAAATVLGVVYALLATPVYFSQATIALKDASKASDASRIFSQLGGVGGAVASQLGVGNANIDKMEIILNGYDLAERVVTHNNLLPVLFFKEWDSSKGRWKASNPKKVPTTRQGVALLRQKILSVEPELKKNVIKVGINFHDPLIAKKMVDMYLQELNDGIRNEVILDAETNRAYLDKQLGNTLDPILQEKLRAMMAYEVERSMLISSKSFDVLEKPIVPDEKVEPKRSRIVFLSMVLGFFFSIASIILIRVYSSFAAKLREHSTSGAINVRDPGV